MTYAAAAPLAVYAALISAGVPRSPVAAGALVILELVAVAVTARALWARYCACARRREATR